jgi:hypothetical protein
MAMTIEESIKTACDGLTIQKDTHIEIVQEILEIGGGFCRFHTYIFALIKRSIDILDSFIYATLTYNLNIQIPLLRLQIDNCITLYGIMLLDGKEDVLSALFKGNHRWSNYKHPVTNERLSESKLAQEIGNIPRYKDFYEMYKFCCNFVHFSRKIINSTIQANSTGHLKSSICLGNKDMPKDVLTNANSMIETTKILFWLINDSVDKNQGAEILSEL